MTIFKIKFLFAIFSILFLFSCKDDDDTTQEAKCYITKFNKVTIAVTGQQLYSSEYVYNDNRIIKKLNYSLVQNNNSGVPTYEPQLSTTINIEYNSINQPIKIIEPVDYNNNQYIEYLSYDNNGRLSEKNRVLNNYNDGSSYTKNFKYNYDSSNKIILISEKSTTSWGDVYGENTKVLTYDSNENLRMIEQTTTDLPTVKIVTKYDNYDTYKNPYANINVPFEDIFFLRLSKNNYRKYSKTTIYTNNSPNNPAPSYEISEISGYEYNEHGYPKFAEYKCN